MPNQVTGNQILESWSKKPAGTPVESIVRISSTTAMGGDLHGSVGSAFLNDLVVTTGKLANLAVTTAKLADLAVTAGKIADGTITLSKLAFTPEVTSNKNVAGGYAGLDGSGRINSAQLPPIAITDTSVVASQAAMLALTAETGDVAVRTDLTKSFILKGTDPTNVSHWQELLTPPNAVLSVNGLTGAVSLTIPTVSGTTNAITYLSATNTIATSRMALGAGGTLDVPWVSGDTRPALNVGSSAATGVVMRVTCGTSAALDAINNGSTATIFATNNGAGPSIEANGLLKCATFQLATSPTLNYPIVCTNAATGAAGFGTLTMGGDISGAHNAVTVAKIQGKAVHTTAPTDKQVLRWNASNSRYEPGAITLVLPYNDTLSSGSDLFSITNSGVGRAIAGSSAGAGDGIRASNTSTGFAFFGINTSTGAAAYFQTNLTTNAAHTVAIEQNGNGNCLDLILTNATASTTTARNFIICELNGAHKWRVDSTGKTFQNGASQNNGADMAEKMPFHGVFSDYEPGDVLIISSSLNSTVRKSQSASQNCLYGVVSTRPATIGCPEMFDEFGVPLEGEDLFQALEGLLTVAVIGNVPIKVCNENGSIARRDRLVTSSTPGYAMKAGSSPDPYTVIGQAMEPMTGTTGIINGRVNII